MERTRILGKDIYCSTCTKKWWWTPLQLSIVTCPEVLSKYLVPLFHLEYHVVFLSQFRGIPWNPAEFCTWNFVKFCRIPQVKTYSEKFDFRGITEIHFRAHPTHLAEYICSEPLRHIFKWVFSLSTCKGQPLATLLKNWNLTEDPEAAGSIQYEKKKLSEVLLPVRPCLSVQPVAHHNVVSL